jgi:hypothetical protein
MFYPRRLYQSFQENESVLSKSYLLTAGLLAAACYRKRQNE